ncbi:putative Ig-like domain-containing protein [Seiridium cardinale]
MSVLRMVTTLETALVNTNGALEHYRLSQSGLKAAGPPDWVFVETIATNAAGPACFFQREPKKLNLFVYNVFGQVDEYLFQDGEWTFLQSFSSDSAACAFIRNPAVPPETVAIVRKGVGLNMVYYVALRDTLAKTYIWPVYDNLLPTPLGSLFRFVSPLHRDNRFNPMAVVSPGSYGSCFNAEAILFHLCGSGWQSNWMVLHLTYLSTIKEWVLNGVFLARVNGVPMHVTWQGRWQLASFRDLHLGNKGA